MTLCPSVPIICWNYQSVKNAFNNPDLPKNIITQPHHKCAPNTLAYHWAEAHNIKSLQLRSFIVCCRAKRKTMVYGLWPLVYTAERLEECLNWNNSWIMERLQWGDHQFPPSLMRLENKKALWDIKSYLKCDLIECLLLSLGGKVEKS